jgi:small subunit ribosomal protein S19e
MTSIRDESQSRIVTRTAEELKKSIKQPEWSIFVKTGVSRERAPEQKDWWYIRSASVLRKVYLDGPVGVQKLRSYYGGLHRRGHKPAHFARGSGKVLRSVMQQLEQAGYVKKEKKGRVATSEGIKLLNRAARHAK